MERVIYEFRPHIYFAVAFYAIAVSHSSWLMIASGLILGYCGYTVMNLRSQYRRRKAMMRKDLSRISFGASAYLPASAGTSRASSA